MTKNEERAAKVTKPIEKGKQKKDEIKGWHKVRRGLIIETMKVH